MSTLTNDKITVWLFSKGLIGTWTKRRLLTITLIPQFLWNFFYSVLQIKQRKPISISTSTGISIKRIFICFLLGLREYRGLFFIRRKNV